MNQLERVRFLSVKSSIGCESVEVWYANDLLIYSPQFHGRNCSQLRSEEKLGQYISSLHPIMLSFLMRISNSVLLDISKHLVGFRYRSFVTSLIIYFLSFESLKIQLVLTLRAESNSIFCDVRFENEKSVKTRENLCSNFSCFSQKA